MDNPIGLITKTLVIVIILLFGCTSITSSTAFDNLKKPSKTVFNGNILYVGGSGPGNYTRIQDAIDNASDGDTVFVFDDSSPYYENILISKCINLTGENKYTTVVDGNGSYYVVSITKPALHSTIQGFTIKNGKHGIRIESNNNIIIDNIISNNNWGISIDTGTNNYIISNNITLNKFAGISICYSHNNTIEGNRITLNEWDGIDITFLSENNTIKNNFIQKNTVGIQIYGCYYTVITGNNILKNDRSIELVDQSAVVENNNIETLLACGNMHLFRKNNFIGNTSHVVCINCFLNIWDSNYWDDWIGVKFNLPIFQRFPKIIKCWFGYPYFPPKFFYQIPYLNFDWHPAKEPYDIGV